MSDKELNIKKAQAKPDLAVDSPTEKSMVTEDKAKPNTMVASSKKGLNKETVEKKVTSISKSKTAENESDHSLTVSKSELSVKNGHSFKTLKITLCRSLIGCRKSHRACAKGLGLRRRESIVEVLDTPENMGMINQISYLLKVES